MSTTGSADDHQQALRRLELAMTRSAQSLSGHLHTPRTRTNEEWLWAFAGNLTEIIRAAARYLDTEQATAALRRQEPPPGVTSLVRDRSAAHAGRARLLR
jgi:hypothetical protein